MVNTRMEGRVETMEKEMDTLKVDMMQMKEMMLMMKDTLERVEKKVDKGGERDHSEGSGAQGEGDKEKDSEEVNDKAKDSGEANDGDGSRHRKLELPIFEGDEAIGWLFKVERYFSLNKMSDDEKLEAVAVCMEGKALNWLQWLETRMNIASWEMFKGELLRRFHQAQRGNGYEMLMALKQEESVAEFREKFELLSAPLKNAPEEMLIGAYQNGLKEEIRMRGESSRSVSSSASNSKGRYRKLTDEELARKRRLGECWTCDEKWGPTHKCKNKHLHVLILSGPVEEAETVEWDIGEEDIQEEEELTGSLMSLSMNSIVGITGGRTMKLVGKVNGKEVLIMIDSGASHNFISTSLVDKMTLPKVKTSSYVVTVGDGHTVKSEGKCKQLRVELQDTVLEQNFY
ncbi:Retrotransposable element Tf2 [Senna tora]|uniref:Retrotransposable element Tf2 n=1 Tax=Senna tora TaxID=362788 RepID=A0A834W9X5_9FABA|nr:Retrotransposable element Tf2 [Senna tora]